MAIQLTKELIHDFHRRVAEGRVVFSAPEGSEERMRQEEELVLFRRYMSGELGEDEKRLAAEAEAEGSEENRSGA